MIDFIKRMLSHREPKRKEVQVVKRQQLEQQVQEGAEEAVKRYRGVFKRLAEYDRT